MTSLPKRGQQNDTNTSSNNNQKSQQQLKSAGYGGKEHGRFTVEDMSGKKKHEVEEVGRVEIAPEVESAGVTAAKEYIEIPPDLKKLGVKQSGATTPVKQDNSSKGPALPISDKQVVAGLHTQVMSSFRWLAEWCVKRLKVAHLALKEVHGKIVRVKS